MTFLSMEVFSHALLRAERDFDTNTENKHQTSHVQMKKSHIVADRKQQAQMCFEDEAGRATKRSANVRTVLCSTLLAQLEREQPGQCTPT
jgi:hypothetical protein